MIMNFDTFTLVHVALSLIGIGAGFVMLAGILGGRLLPGWTALFLATTVATNVTGFGFPFERLLPSHVVGLLSLAVLALAVLARYGQRLAGGWRRVFVISALTALYFNVFVLVVQLFQKVPALHALAPTQSEAPFAAAQGVVLAGFVGLNVVAVRRFRG